MRWPLTPLLLLAASMAVLFAPHGAADPPEECFGTGPDSAVDLFFVFDLTGSMNEEIDSVKAGAQDLTDTLADQIPGIRFAVAGVQDYNGWYAYPGQKAVQYGAAGDSPWRVFQGLTSSQPDIISAINSMHLGDGGDRPEAYSRAYHEMATLADWRDPSDAVRVVVIWGDAFPHDDDFEGFNNGLDPGRDAKKETADDLDFQDVVADLVANEVRILAVDAYDPATAPDQFAEPFFRYAADQTGGTYVQLNGADTLAQEIIDYVSTVIPQDSVPPSVDFGVPAPGRMYVNGIDEGVGPYPDRAAVVGDLAFTATAGDNCQLESVDFTTTPDASWSHASGSATTITTGAFPAATQPPGQYVAHAEATDWVDLTGTDDAPFEIIDATPFFELPSPCIALTTVTGDSGTPLSFDVQASSLLTTRDITLTLLSGPTGMTFAGTPGNPATGTGSWPDPAAGQYTAIIKADNGFGTATCEVPLDIAFNPPPVFDLPLECQTGNPIDGIAGQALSFGVQASSGNPDRTLALVLQTGPAGFTLTGVTGTNPIAGTAGWPEPTPGVHGVVFVATDDQDRTATCAVDLAIANPPPTISGPVSCLANNGIVEGIAGEPLAFDLTGASPVASRTVTISVLSPAATFTLDNAGPGNPLTTTVHWADPAEGAVQASFRVTDSYGNTADCVIDIDIIDPPPFFHDGPVVCAISVVAGTQGQAIEFPVTAESPVAARTVTLAIVTGPAGGTLIDVAGTNPVTATWSWPDPQAGSHNLLVRATDNHGNTADCPILLDIDNPPPAFTVCNPGATLGYHGEALTVPLAAVTSVAGRTLTIAIADPVAGITIAPHTAAASVQTSLSWSNPIEGDWEVLVQALDSEGKTDHCVVLLAIGNPPPVFTSPACGSTHFVADAGDPVTFDVTAQSPRPSRSVSLAVLSAPTGLALGTGSGSNPVTAPASWPSTIGHHVTTFEATDNFGKTAHCTVTFAIGDPLPVVTAPPECGGPNLVAALEAMPLAIGTSAVSPTGRDINQMDLAYAPAGSGVTLADFVAGDPGTATLEWPSPTGGLHEAVIRAIDDQGAVTYCVIDFNIGLDADADGIDDGVDNCPDTANHDQTDGDSDGAGDACDDFPTDPTETMDSDGDGSGDNTDNCIATSNAGQADHDGDGDGDACDGDDDDDGIGDGADGCPRGETGWISSAGNDGDGDGCRDATEDTDDDNDGTPDGSDAFPTDPTEANDSDGDGTGDNGDEDDDNDGTPDKSDAFPTDPAETTDSDGDGTGDNADTDDDNDGVPDGTDDCTPGETGWTASPTTDADADGCQDASEDTDDDNDGHLDGADNCPTIANPDQADSDNPPDGQGDACDPDTDSDNDDVPNLQDNCPNDANTNQANSDNDSLGDACDPDDDNDGTPDDSDAFPTNPNEQTDTDGDGIGDNADPDDDNDGSPDSHDAFPHDPAESSDCDNDGVGDNTETDDDNDGVPDGSDAFPCDATETTDSDGDGTGDNADPDDDNDGLDDVDDPFPTDKDGDNDGTDDGDDNCPSDANASQVDSDGDGKGDVCDDDPRVIRSLSATTGPCSHELVASLDIRASPGATSITVRENKGSGVTYQKPSGGGIRLGNGDLFWNIGGQTAVVQFEVATSGNQPKPYSFGGTWSDNVGGSGVIVGDATYNC